MWDRFTLFSPLSGACLQSNLLYIMLLFRQISSLCPSLVIASWSCIVLVIRRKAASRVPSMAALRLTYANKMRFNHLSPVTHPKVLKLLENIDGRCHQHKSPRALPRVSHLQRLRSKDFNLHMRSRVGFE